MARNQEVEIRMNKDDLERFEKACLTLKETEEKMALIGRRRETDPRMPLHMRLAIHRKLRKGGLSNDERAVLEEALDNFDAIELISAQAQDEGITPPDQPRDWAGFFEALASFLERIIPLLLQLFGMMGGTPV